jgi:hypothetical protein
LEEGTHGAAYLALNKDAPVFPVTFTGTTNNEIVSNLKSFKRTKMSITFGPSFTLQSGNDRRAAIRSGTIQIMSRLALQLPPNLRGVYLDRTETLDGC